MGNVHWIALGALLASLGPGPARANFMLTAQSAVASPGAVNDMFNVYLTNLGTTPVDVVAFNFSISTTSTDIVFQRATTATTLFPYIFSGNSQLGPVISFSPPGQTLGATDVTAAPMSFTMVNPGASFGLGEVFFDVTSNAPAQMTPVDFNAITSISDQVGNSIPLQFSNGEITITAATTVPEPSSAFLLSTALTCVLATGLIVARQGDRGSPVSLTGP